ncbi:MarR family transcriptional regulator [Nocardioides sp. STR2]|uniref:MarR family transcriptional regulator n=1 Tax=Nocardioides pini TaxID=2975053 RepID=A0ABT4C6V7_9ACTN|nr:MarR family transcriptional regulator [Nocardioides pini]MCY4724686.1 MarR family transcriptional regulator [Nocardioides pini]
MTNIDRQHVDVNVRGAPERDDGPRNIVVQLREAYATLNALVPERLVDHGFLDFRPAHSSVFEHLDDSGTTVSTLAERATMTKQAMGELVAHLEAGGYVVRVPDPNDRRAKLVLPTDRGREVYRVARSLVPELHEQIAELLGTKRFLQLRKDLDLVQRTFASRRDT